MLFTYEYNLNLIFLIIQIIDVEIEVAFNFIYTMHYNVLMNFLTFQDDTWVEPSTFNMLKPLLMSFILHLPHM